LYISSTYAELDPLRKGSAAAELYDLTAEAAKNSFAIYKAKHKINSNSLEIIINISPSIFVDE
jgi:hypothetical protein